MKVRRSASELRRVFSSHPTATYVGLVRSVRQLPAGAAVLHAHAGVIPPGEEARAAVGRSKSPADVEVRSATSVPSR